MIAGRAPAYNALTAEQRDELRAVYKTIAAFHHLSFEECLVDASLRICLWNVAQARRKTLARKAAASTAFHLS